LHGPRIVRP